MKRLVPVDVEDRGNGYKGRIVEVVFDPLRIAEVNARFKAEGFVLGGDEDDATRVIAVCEDGAILVWGGVNSVFHLRKGERIAGPFDKVAFDDVVRLARPFNFKHTRGEVAGMVEALKRKYTPGE